MRAPDWDALHASLHRRVHLIARSVLRDEHEAEDAVQDTFLRALGSVGSLREPLALTGWLLVVARRAALSRRRRLRRSLQVAEADPETTLDCREGLPADAMELAEVYARLTPALQRAVDQELRGLTLKEAAIEEGVSVAAVKTRRSRAKARIRQLVLA